MSKTPDKIINIAIAAHVDAGKTTLTEQILYKCNVIRTAGSVDSGTTQTDRMDIERERGISIKAAVTSLTAEDCDINIIDTPGHTDFAGEVERVIGAADGVILVVSAVEGIQSNTKKIWNAINNYNLPALIFINKIDRTGSDFEKIIKNIEIEFGLPCLCLNFPLNEGSKEFSVKTIDNNLLIEKAADYNEEIAFSYIENILIDEKKLNKAILEIVKERKAIPVLCGSASLGIGIDEILKTITKYFPRADEKSVNELSAYIFKIEHDRDIGKIAYVRLFGGEIKNRDMILNTEKITQIRKWSGSKYYDTGKVSNGDIAALCGLVSVRVANYIGERGKCKFYKMANPYLSSKIKPNNPAELAKLIEAVQEMTEEDPLINYRWEKTKREVNVDLTGNIQIEVMREILLRKYKIDTVFSLPSVIYKETPAREGVGFEAYTMPKPCWAVVKLGITPLPRGSGVVWDGGKVPHNKLFYKYQEHIKNSLFDSIECGRKGWAVTDMLVTLQDGEHHTIHTHPLDFFVATPMALADGLIKTGTTLLEPLIKVRITSEENFLGKIISDILLMRGSFDTPVITYNIFTMEAILPVSSSLEYPVKLASMTSGKALYIPEFYGYRECPDNLGAIGERQGIDPADRAQWILHARGAFLNKI